MKQAPIPQWGAPPQEAGEADVRPEVPWAVERTIRDIEWWNEVPWTALHERLRTVPAIPDQLHVEIASCRAALADAVLTHTGTHLEDAAWKAMAFTDRLLFHTARPSRGGARGRGAPECHHRPAHSRLLARGLGIPLGPQR